MKKVIIFLVASIALFIAIGNWPYGYYQLLRIFITVVSIYGVTLSIKKNKIGWTWLLGSIAVIFNPIILMHIDKETWKYIDVGVGSVFISYFIFMLLSDNPNLIGYIRVEIIPRLITIIKYIIVPLLCIITIIITVFWLKEEKYWIFKTGTQEVAILNITWRMSEKEVERAINTKLSNTNIPFLFDTANIPDMGKRIKHGVQRNARYLSGIGNIEYIFIDDELFEVMIFIESCKPDLFGKEVSDNLNNRFGIGTFTDKTNSYRWYNNKVRVIYSQNQDSKGAYIFLIYNPLLEKIQKKE